MSDTYKALDQSLALNKDPISMGKEGQGRGKRREKKEVQRRSDIREKQSTQCC